MNGRKFITSALIHIALALAIAVMSIWIFVWAARITENTERLQQQEVNTVDDRIENQEQHELEDR